MAQKNVSSLSISIGMLTTRGGLFAVRDNSGTRATKLVMVCPKCRKSQVAQSYSCLAGCKPDDKTKTGWTTGEIPDRGRIEGKTLHVLTAAELAAAAESVTALMKGVLDVWSHPVDQVESETYPSGAAYCFRPDKPEADKVYALLVEMAADPSRALVGMLNMRDTERLYRLTAYQGTLRVVELLRPEETAQFAAMPAPSVSDAERSMFRQLCEAMTEDFDAQRYASTRLAALQGLIEAKVGGVAPTPITAAQKPSGEVDVMAALQASLAAAVAARSAA